MPRIQPVNGRKATDEIRQMLDGVRSRLGMTPNLVRTMAHSEATLAGYLGLSEALDRGELSRREREQIALAVAEANGCRYCLAAHSAAGKLVGLSELEVRDARLGAAIVKRERAILILAAAVLAQRGHISDEVLHRARQADLTDGEITEVVANVALHVFTNYLNSVARTEIDFPAVPALDPRRTA